MTTTDELCQLTLVELTELVATREVLAIEATDAALRRIERLESSLNAFATVTAERARVRARELDAELDRGGKPRPLHGVPIALKDNIDLAGVPTTAGSRLLRDSVPDRTATAAARLEDAGAVVVGKANLWEFGYGAPSGLLGRALNPWDRGRTTGASSSGSAAAVAAGLCAASLATDSGGSIRIPASFCGVVGLKPSYGLVPADGALPVSPSLDHIGPLARTAADVGAVLAAAAGVGPEPRSLAGARLGVPPRASLEPLSVEAVHGLDDAVATLRDAGASVGETAIPDLGEGSEVKWTISGYEAARHHDERKYGGESGYEPAVWRLLELGRAIGPAEYERALRRRDELRADFETALAGLDALLLPATPMPPFLIEAEGTDALLASTRFTALFNVTGSPALAIPAELSTDGLPIGVQLVGPDGSDAAVLGLGAAFERARGPMPTPPATRSVENDRVVDNFTHT